MAEDTQDRKGLEAALIAVHRRNIGRSPTANFGRMIPGYRQSSYSCDGDVGGPLAPGESEPNSEPGVGPLDWSNADSLFADDWMGLNWKPPRRLAAVPPTVPASDGLYRIWNSDSDDCLHYIGMSSNLKSRLQTHRRERDGKSYYSYAQLDNHDALHKRQEVETELIGAHWLECERAPTDQF
ncbi:GIY-YIG nuclease family protein [Haloferax massiliensis]|nr:GIY-YIG nuclease family protein [Haloferax massiliensis]